MSAHWRELARLLPTAPHRSLAPAMCFGWPLPMGLSGGIWAAHVLRSQEDASQEKVTPFQEPKSRRCEGEQPRQDTAAPLTPHPELGLEELAGKAGIVCVASSSPCGSDGGPYPQGPCGSWEGTVADFLGFMLSALGGNPNSALRVLGSTQVRSVRQLLTHCKDSPPPPCLTTVEMDSLAVLEVRGLTRSPWANLGLWPGWFFLEAQEEKLFPFPASRDTCTSWPSAPSAVFKTSKGQSHLGQVISL